MGQDYEDPIQHVVVLMLENRSFDQMLGDFQRVYPNLDGIEPAGSRRTNTDDQGQRYEQLPTTVRCASNDPDHKLDSVLRQIGAAAAVPGADCRRSIFIRLPKAIWGAVCSWFLWLWNKLWGRARKMVAITEARRVYEGHFVAEYVRTFPNSTRAQRDEIMGYFPLGSLPALHFLARNFTVCDRWFSSVPGPTWANRFFVHTGTCRGITRMPDYTWDFHGYALYDQRTIYDELTDHHVKWRIYYHDVPQTLALSNQWQSENAANYSRIEKFEADVTGPPSDFPAYVFIEPQYNGDDANDDHPPYDLRGFRCCQFRY